MFILIEQAEDSLNLLSVEDIPHNPFFVSVVLLLN